MSGNDKTSFYINLYTFILTLYTVNKETKSVKKRFLCLLGPRWKWWFLDQELASLRPMLASLRPYMTKVRADLRVHHQLIRGGVLFLGRVTRTCLRPVYSFGLKLCEKALAGAVFGLFRKILSLESPCPLHLLTLAPLLLFGLFLQQGLLLFLGVLELREGDRDALRPGLPRVEARDTVFLAPGQRAGGRRADH